MTRKRSPDSTTNRQRIQFAYNADCDTSVGDVFTHLLKNDKLPSRKGKHKGLDAMTAFWLPFAIAEKAGINQDEVQAAAKESVEALARQMALICETFGVEPPQSESTAASRQLKQEIRSLVTEVVQEFVAVGALVGKSPAQNPPAASSSAVEPSVPQTEEGVDFDEDALLGGLFDGAEIAA